MDINAAIDNLATILQNHAGLTAWRTSYQGGKAFTVIKGNRPLKTVNASKLPALIFEVQPLTVSERLGNAASDVEGGIDFALVWVQHDPDQAFVERVGLPELIVQAVMNDRKLGGAARSARVADITPLDGEGPQAHVRLVRVSVATRWQVDKV